MNPRWFAFACAGALHACKTPIVDGSGGAAATATTNTSLTATTSTVAPGCGSLPCQDADMEPANDCISCSQTTGLCIADAQSCLENRECGAFIDCVNACPDDDPGTMADENFDCLCANDGMTCTGATLGTCVGDHQAGIDDYRSLVTCVLGDSMGNDGECGLTCSE